MCSALSESSAGFAVHFRLGGHSIRWCQRVSNLYAIWLWCKSSVGFLVPSSSNSIMWCFESSWLASSLVYSFLILSLCPEHCTVKWEGNWWAPQAEKYTLKPWPTFIMGAWTQRCGMKFTNSALFCFNTGIWGAVLSFFILCIWGLYVLVHLYARRWHQIPL